jgi:hypothetical protein
VYGERLRPYMSESWRPEISPVYVCLNCEIDDEPWGVGGTLFSDKPTWGEYNPLEMDGNQKQYETIH